MVDKEPLVQRSLSLTQADWDYLDDCHAHLEELQGATPNAYTYRRFMRQAIRRDQALASKSEDKTDASR